MPDAGIPVDPAALTRRRFLAVAGAAGLALAGCGGVPAADQGDAVSPASTPRTPQSPPPAAPLAPVGFVAHGAPFLAVDAVKAAPLEAWARAIPRPSAILVFSAHWEEDGVVIGTLETRGLMYDFYGFPPELYELEYAAPPAPKVAARVKELLGADGVTHSPWRGWDHGTWVPLLRMWPGADIPLLQVSLPRKMTPAQQIAIGRKLAPLRAENVFILGSGNLTHNLRRMDFSSERPETPAWAADFDAWIEGVLTRKDLDGLAKYQEAPGFRMSHPTDEHFRPVLIAAGAGVEGGGAVTYPLSGFEGGSISRRSVQIG